MMSDPEWTTGAAGLFGGSGRVPPLVPSCAFRTAANGELCPKKAEVAGGSGPADWSHYSANSNSSSVHSEAVECKRTRNGTAQLQQNHNKKEDGTLVMAHLLVANRTTVPSTANTTDTTTSDFTSSGFTSSTDGTTSSAAAAAGAGAVHHQQQVAGAAAMLDSFSSGCAEVGGDPSGEDDESPQGAPVVLDGLPRNNQKLHQNGANKTRPQQHLEPTETEQGQQQQQQHKTKRKPAGGQNGAALAPTASTDSVRRVASFTFSPPGASRFLDAEQYARWHKRNSMTAGAGVMIATGALTDKMHRKTTLGPLGKTLHFLRNKLDFSMSASVLCPSREECRLWQESFESLLCHKYGCHLFREFLQSEFSEENLEFWLDCEEFKRMKAGKKATAQKAQQIFDTYVKELAVKEVNLDSQTRLATKRALQEVPIRVDMFDLAQNKIQQLMAKDSYPRFLKSDPYLELINEEGKRLLRVTSVKENSLHSVRSPSLSPKLGRPGEVGGPRWSARRNTCAPTGPVGSTLQIPSITE